LQSLMKNPMRHHRANPIAENRSPAQEIVE